MQIANRNANRKGASVQRLSCYVMLQCQCENVNESCKVSCKAVPAFYFSCIPCYMYTYSFPLFCARARPSVIPARGGWPREAAAAAKKLLHCTGLRVVGVTSSA